MTRYDDCRKEIVISPGIYIDLEVLECCLKGMWNSAIDAAQEVYEQRFQAFQGSHIEDAIWEELKAPI